MTSIEKCASLGEVQACWSVGMILDTCEALDHAIQLGIWADGPAKVRPGR